MPEQHISVRLLVEAPGGPIPIEELPPEERQRLRDRLWVGYLEILHTAAINSLRREKAAALKPKDEEALDAGDG